MRCRQFRSLHDAYVDDVLSAGDMDRMRTHLDVCAECARLDTRVRRGLLVARNLTPITPSADFSARLEARLCAVRTEMCGRRVTERDDLVFPPASRFAVLARQIAGHGVRTLATAAAIAGVAVVATYLAQHPDPTNALRPTPMVASVSDSGAALTLSPMTSPLAPPMYVTPVPVGMGIVPAVMTAGQATAHFASLEYGR